MFFFYFRYGKVNKDGLDEVMDCYWLGWFLENDEVYVLVYLIFFEEFVVKYWILICLWWLFVIFFCILIRVFFGYRFVYG